MGSHRNASRAVVIPAKAGIQHSHHLIHVGVGITVLSNVQCQH